MGQKEEEVSMKNCRECRKEVSEQAHACPQCGAPYPAKEKWDGWGFEYRSNQVIGNIPLIHISFKYSHDRKPVVAKGVIAIGQFAVGIVTISQFGIGVFSLSQFSIAGFAIAQFALAYSLIAQFGVFLGEGKGSFVYSLLDLLKSIF
jgi:hypothetical protein